MKFINISNHPIAKWGEAQRKAAGLLSGQVEGIDLPFPPIPPQASEEEVGRMATDLLAQVRAIGGPSEDAEDDGVWAVHLMGEQGLVFALASALLMGGVEKYLVLCSTTERRVIEQGGQKVSTFEFIQFRSLGGCRRHTDNRTEAERQADKARSDYLASIPMGDHRDNR